MQHTMTGPSFWQSAGASTLYHTIECNTTRLCTRQNGLSIRVANITDFSVEVRNSENDPYFSRFLYGVSKSSDFLRILKFFDFFQHFLIGNDHTFWPCSWRTANSDKKYMELNGAALNANKQIWRIRKQPFQKISRGRKWKIMVTLL